VTRHDDAQRITPNRLTDFVCRCAVGQFGCQLTVGFGLAVADVVQQFPDPALPRVADQGGGQIELLPLTG
jgi:hypothetical protein